MKTEFNGGKKPRNVSFLSIIDFCFTRLQRTIAAARCFDSDRSTCCSWPLLKIANPLSEEASTIDGDREKKGRYESWRKFMVKVKQLSLKWIFIQGVVEQHTNTTYERAPSDSLLGFQEN